MILEVFREGLGRVLGGFGEGLGRVLERFWGPFGRSRGLSRLFLAVFGNFLVVWTFFSMFF